MAASSFPSGRPLPTGGCRAASSLPTLQHHGADAGDRLGLKDLAHQVILEAEALGLRRAFPMVGPECVLGIELNRYAAELARVTVWIGEIQWMLGHGFSLSKNPTLKPLQIIEQRDAIMNADGAEPECPAADVIAGDPPFLGDTQMLGGLGAEYVNRLRKLCDGRVPGGADLVTYWFEKARAQIAASAARFAGLVATNRIRAQRPPGPRRRRLRLERRDAPDLPAVDLLRRLLALNLESP